MKNINVCVWDKGCIEAVFTYPDNAPYIVIHLTTAEAADLRRQLQTALDAEDALP